MTSLEQVLLVIEQVVPATHQSLLGLVLFVALPHPDLLDLLDLALRYLLPSLPTRQHPEMS